jgi:hypothetical protein
MLRSKKNKAIFLVLFVVGIALALWLWKIVVDSDSINRMWDLQA